MKKTCTKCKKEKPIEEFGRCAKVISGLRSWCKKCSNKDADDRVRLKTDWLKIIIG
jgi:hypothetical protein